MPSLGLPAPVLAGQRLERPVSTFDPQKVAAAIAAAADALQHPQSSDDQLLAIALAARDSMPNFDLVGISTVDRRGSVVTRAVTDEAVCELDRLQYSQGEGPCVDAMVGASRVVVAPRLRHEQRWPRFVAPALKLGLRAQLAVQISLDDQGTLGSLNMYSLVSDDIDEDDASLAELFAGHAAIALGGSRKIQDLQTALQTRQVIGEALGIVMERYGLSEERAFAFLVRASSTSNTKLRLLAQDIVDRVGRDGA
jgi:GAF domain-containing protein